MSRFNFPESPPQHHVRCPGSFCECLLCTEQHEHGRTESRADKGSHRQRGSTRKSEIAT